MVYFLFARARGVERSLWGEGLGYVCKRAFKLFCKQDLKIKHQSWSWCEGWGAVLSLGGRGVGLEDSYRSKKPSNISLPVFAQNVKITPGTKS